MNNINHLLPLSIIMSALLLSGCQKTSFNKNNQPVHQAVKPTAEENEAAQLQQCQKSLEALQTVKIPQSEVYKKTFDQLMKGAAQYSGIRNRIKDQTQDTVDALYRYRVSKLCAQIDQALLLGLTENGESTQ